MADLIHRYEVKEPDGARLLDFMFSALSDKKRTQVKSLLKYGQIKVNDKVTTKFDHGLKVGDVVAVNFSHAWPVLKNARLKIYYEDDDVIVVYKGYGLLSVATDRKKEGTAYSILRDYVKKSDPRNKIFIVHRLDQHTSGLMVFAKNEESKNILQHNWNNMVLERRYVAVVEGRPEHPSGVQKSYLAENVRHLVYSVSNPEEGQLAVTRWKTIKSRGRYSLIEVMLDTGRKNQIRVHLSEMGLPIVGDKRYGAKTAPIGRLALHAATLRFVHPKTRKDMNFNSDIPASFAKLV